jgi:micrococcal nuclease
MNRRRALVAGCLLLLVSTAGCVASTLTSGGQDTYNGTVTHVVDGDTVDVRLANGTTERVRLLGIDTPEVHVETEPADFQGVPDTDAGRACLRAAGETASTVVADRLEGERIRLELDPAADRRGGYGRLLAYVYHDGTNVNYVLVERGHAGVYPSTFQERSRFEAAASGARDANRGLWQCRQPS